MTARSAYMKNLNRERVLEFEKEMLAKLATLADVERDIADVSQKRKAWLSNISRTDDTGMDVYIAKLNILKLRSQLSALSMQLDVARLEGHYEAQTLNYLVAATQPLEDDETPEKRKMSLLRQQRADNDVLMGLLEQSLQYRIQLGNTNYDLNSQLTLITNEVGLQQIAEEREFREKIAFYTSRMQNSVEISKQHHQRITEEYLVLRHNARVAKEILTRGQNDAAQARAELQNCLEGIISEAATQREKMEKNAAAELKFLTEDLRGDVVKKEIELENMTMRVKLLKSRQKKEVKTLQKELRAYNKKYKTLQKQRKEQITTVQAELRALRDSIARVEERLLAGTVGAAAAGAVGDTQGSPVGVAASFENGHGAIAQVRQRLKQLNH